MKTCKLFFLWIIGVIIISCSPNGNDFESYPVNYEIGWFPKFL